MMDKIDEATILKNLENRYAINHIYTNIGPVLIAINPFKLYPELYTQQNLDEYRGKKHYEVAPHVYCLADDAYSNMVNYRENHCVIISGESGAGKTETSKIFMQYVSSVSGNSADVVRVKDRMLQSNPVLEAFGNAKTVNNNNSSRFGKYMEILFDYGGDPVGGRVTNYLLEKSRVVTPSEGERNFHVFYQYCKCASPQQKQQYSLQDPSYYVYLNQTGCYDVDGINDQKEYNEVQQAMAALEFNASEIESVAQCISVILWVGNLTFTQDDGEAAHVQDPQVLQVLGALLQVDAAAIEKALCERKIQAGRGEVFQKPNNKANAEFTRDTLAKAMYSKLFDWLVLKINKAIANPGWDGILIGVLDIYGFEIFQYNSFEQLCINFVNEKLQQIFIQLTLKAEQEEYVAEGIPWKEIEYYDNKPLCELIENKPGLLSVCDDCCNTSRTDEMFSCDLGANFASNTAIACGNMQFTIRHFAGDVTYQVGGFLTKNKDQLFDDLVSLLQLSPAPLAEYCGWKAIVVSSGQKRKPPTVGMQFKKQVAVLMSSLMACVPHYIRCIKPNNTKRPNDWDKKNVVRQVKYLGLLENVRVRRAGYATRSTFVLFVQRYRCLVPNMPAGSPEQQVMAIVQYLGWTPKKEFEMGRTKIFIAEAASLFQLEDLVERHLQVAVVVIQKSWRLFKAARYFIAMRHAAYTLVNGRKSRRRASCERLFQGDYLDFRYNKMVNQLLKQQAAAYTKETVLFADRCKAAVLKKSGGFFKRLFGGKKEADFMGRFLVISTHALYSFSFGVDEETGKTCTNLFARAELKSGISSVNLSPNADNFVVVHFSDPETKDLLLYCRRKTEFVAVLQHQMQEQGGTLNVTFQDQDQVCINVQKKRNVKLVFAENAKLGDGKDNYSSAKKVWKIWGGAPFTDAREPPQVQVTQSAYQAPRQVQAVSGSGYATMGGAMAGGAAGAGGAPGAPRPAPTAPGGGGGGGVKLKALYECTGNSPEELSFQVGDIIEMVKDESEGWYEGRLNGKVGFVPATYVEKTSGGGGGPPMPAMPAMPAAPGGAGGAGDWQAMTDNGETYYYNAKTGESKWEKPPGF